MASPNQSRRSRVIEGMAIWGSYYRENIDIFVEEYLQLDFLKWFQTALLVMMGFEPNVPVDCCPRNG